MHEKDIIFDIVLFMLLLFVVLKVAAFPSSLVIEAGVAFSLAIKTGAPFFLVIEARVFSCFLECADTRQMLHLDAIK